MGLLEGAERTMDAVTEWAGAFERFSFSYEELIELGEGLIFAVGEQRRRAAGLA